MVELHWLENTSFAHFGRAGLLMLGYDQDRDINITGQPEFRFDNSARALTHACLMVELPERLFGFRGGVTFGDFFSGLTNETPATSAIIKSALDELLREGAIEVRDKEGLVKRKVIQHRTDVKPSTQQLLFNPWMLTEGGGGG